MRWAVALGAVTDSIQRFRERLSRWTEASSEQGLSKDPTVPSECFKRDRARPAHRRCALGDYRGDPKFTGEGLGGNGREREEGGRGCHSTGTTSGGTGGVAEKAGEWRGEWREVEWWSFWEL